MPRSQPGPLDLGRTVPTSRHSALDVEPEKSKIVRITVISPRTEVTRTERSASAILPQPWTPLLQTYLLRAPCHGHPTPDHPKCRVFFLSRTSSARASQDVQRTPHVCCEAIFTDENAQRPPSEIGKNKNKNKKRVGRAAPGCHKKQETKWKVNDGLLLHEKRTRWCMVKQYQKNQ